MFSLSRSRLPLLTLSGSGLKTQNTSRRCLHLKTRLRFSVTQILGKENSVQSIGAFWRRELKNCVQCMDHLIFFSLFSLRRVRWDCESRTRSFAETESHKLLKLWALAFVFRERFLFIGIATCEGQILITEWDLTELELEWNQVNFHNFFSVDSHRRSSCWTIERMKNYVNVWDNFDLKKIENLNFIQTCDEFVEFS